MARNDRRYRRSDDRIAMLCRECWVYLVLRPQNVALEGDACSCGWRATPFRQPGSDVTPTQVWLEHLQLAAALRFEGSPRQFAERTGPDGEVVVFTLESVAYVLTFRDADAEAMRQ